MSQVSTLSFQPFMQLPQALDSARRAQRRLLPSRVSNAIIQAKLESSVFMQIADLMKMRMNWDGQGAAAVSPLAARRMIADMSAIAEGSPHLWAPWLVPGADGSLQAEWDTKDLEILYLIDDLGGRSIYIDDRSVVEEFEAEGDAALTLALRFTKRLVDRQMVSTKKIVLDQGRRSSTIDYMPELETA